MRHHEKKLTNLLDNAAYLSLLALIALSPFVVAPRTEDQFFLPKELFARQMIVIIAAFTFLTFCYTSSDARKVINKALGCKESKLTLPFALFLFIAALSAAKSAYPSTTIASLVDIILGFLLFIGALIIVDSEKRLKGIIYVFLAAGFITGLIAAIQYYGYFPGVVRADSLMPASGRRAAVGLIGNSGISSAYLAAVCLIAIGEMASIKRERAVLRGASLCILTAGALYGFMLSRAVASAAGFAGGLVFFLLGCRRFLSARRFRLTVLCVVLIAGLGMAFYASRGYDVARGIKRGDLASALSNRGIIWLTAWKMAAEKPLLGWGIGRFKIDYYEYYGRALKDIGENSPIRPKANTQWGTAHNEYLQLLSEMGWSGLLAAMVFLWAYFSVLTSLLKGVKAVPGAVKADTGIRAIAFAAAFISLLVNAIGSFPFHIAPTAAMALILSACSLNCCLLKNNGASEKLIIQGEPGSAQNGKFHEARLGLAWAAASITVLYAFINLSSTYSASMHHQKAKDYLSAHRKMYQDAMAKGEKSFDPVYLRAALAEAEKALGKDSNEGKINYLYGKALAMKGSFDKAIAELKRARDKYRETHLDYDLGVVLEAKGEWGKASLFYQRAVDYDPDYFPDPRFRLKEIREKLLTER